MCARHRDILLSTVSFFILCFDFRHVIPVCRRPLRFARAFRILMFSCAITAQVCIDMLGNCSDLWGGAHGGGAGGGYGHGAGQVRTSAGAAVYRLSPAYSVLSCCCNSSFLLDEDLLYATHNGTDAATALADAKNFRVPVGACGTATTRRGRPSQKQASLPMLIFKRIATRGGRRR